MTLRQLIQNEVVIKSQHQVAENEARPKRGRISKKPTNFYFTQETENAIVLYNRLSWTERGCVKEIDSILAELSNVSAMDLLSDDDKSVKVSDLTHKLERMRTQLAYTQHLYETYTDDEIDIAKNITFVKFIKYPLEKIVENMYNKYKLTYFDAPPEHIQAEAVHNILLNLHKFDESRGAKAFSYFTVVAKHHLMQVNNGNHRRYKRSSLMSSMPDNWEVEDDFEDREVIDGLLEFKEMMLEFWEKNLTTVFVKLKDIQIADAILELFRRSDTIENFNKKHLYLLIREMSDCKTQHITRVVNIMKETQDAMMGEFLNTGNIDKVDVEFEGSYRW